MTKNMPDYKSMLLGVGFDGTPEHKYFTKGDNFYLMGGSKSTHDLMLDKIMRFNYLLSKYGKSMDQLSREEYYRIVEEIGGEKIRWDYLHP